MTNWVCFLMGPTIPSDIQNFSDFEEFLNKIKKNVLKRFVLNCDWVTCIMKNSLIVFKYYTRLQESSMILEILDFSSI